MRLGHRDIQTTLGVYGHLMPGADAGSAADVERGLARAVERRNGVPRGVRKRPDLRRLLIRRLRVQVSPPEPS